MTAHYECDLPEPSDLYGNVAWRLAEGETPTFYSAAIDDVLGRVRLTISAGDTHVSQHLAPGVGEALGQMLIAADLQAKQQAGGAS